MGLLFLDEGEQLLNHLFDFLPVGGERFDGKTETAVFPGDLPADPSALFDAKAGNGGHDEIVRFVRFRPPRLERSATGATLSLPHIRLDRALQFLIGDRLA